MTITSERIGSIGFHPVTVITAPEISAAIEPSKSPSTCKSAARTLMLFSERLSSHATRTLMIGHESGRNKRIKEIY